MGRDATKAAGNPWYQARKKAAEYDDRLCSRESAAEQLGMSVSSLADAELGNTKFMPVDKAVLMADRYNAPWLLNHYCLNECPIGCRHSLSDEVVGIDRVTVKLLKSLKTEKLGDGGCPEESVNGLRPPARYARHAEGLRPLAGPDNCIADRLNTPISASAGMGVFLRFQEVSLRNGPSIPPNSPTRPLRCATSFPIYFHPFCQNAARGRLRAAQKGSEFVSKA